MVMIIVVVAVVVGGVSVYFLGRDNPVEKVAEMVVEHELNLPPGTLDLDRPEESKKQ